MGSACDSAVECDKKEEEQMTAICLDEDGEFYWEAGTGGVVELSVLEVAQLIDSEDSSYQIVDVRDSEVASTGYTLRGAVHFASRTFSRQLEAVIKQLSKFDTVVFHCAFSQVRAPQCALRYAKQKASDSQTVAVLSGGFNEFALIYPFSHKKHRMRYYDKLEEDSKDDDFEYVEGAELCHWLDSDSAKLAVIDVRGDDFGPHCVCEALNYPQSTLRLDRRKKAMSTALTALFEACAEKRALVFHCQYSQSRGPSAARTYLAARSLCFDKHSAFFKQKVFVLRHGFRRFYQLYPKYCVKVLY